MAREGNSRKAVVDSTTGGLEERTLVSAKEQNIEDYLESIFQTLEKPEHLSGVQLARLWKEQVIERIYKDSKTLSFKNLSFIHYILDQKIDEIFDMSYGRLKPKKIDTREMVLLYTKYFDQWIDNKYVTFRTGKPPLLGQIDIKDVWILTFFAFLTNRRVENDNMLMLGLVGVSSSGKTTIFESVLMEDAHVATSEYGVGRYSVGKKTLLLFHDIDVRILVVGKEVDKIKAIARTETAIAKVHSGTVTLPSLFLFYSSNRRLMSHEFPVDPNDKPLTTRKFPTDIHRPGGQKVSEEDLVAVQARFVECFVKEVPQMDFTDLPNQAGFQRLHGIYGLFPRIMDILDKYRPSEYKSPYLYLYALKGLCLFAKRYEDVMFVDVKDRIAHLVFRLASPDLVEDIIKDLE